MSASTLEEKKIRQANMFKARYLETFCREKTLKNICEDNFI